jgi:hypothetical protein
MEIREKADPKIGDLLKDAIAALEEHVDKSAPPKDLVIADDIHYQEVWKKLQADKDGLAKVYQTLKPFKSLAFTLHRTITGKESMYAEYYEKRIKAYDAAIVDRKAANDRAKAELERQLQEQARAEDDARKKEEAEALRKRAAAENREDLKHRAEQIEKAPVRETHIAIEDKTPAVKGNGWSGGFRERYIAECEDEDALILAIGRPLAYLEVAAWIVAEFGKNKAALKIATELKVKAGALPVIPTSVVKVEGGKLTSNANATNGKMDWPGVSVRKDSKTTTRRR